MSLASLGWVQDGLDEAETETINWFGNFGEAEVAASAISLDWMEDGIQAGETRAIEELSYLANRDAGAARRIVLMPFLATLGPADVPALESLRLLAAYDPGDLSAASCPTKRCTMALPTN